MNVVKLAICGILCTITTLVTMTTSALSNDYYELLGVSKTANIKDIKRAYRRMAAKYHPDRNKDDPEANDKFIRLSKIHEVLSDPDKRALYDRFGEAGLDSSGQPEHRPTHFQPSQFHYDFTDMFHDEPRQEDFHFQFADFFDDVRQSDHHDNQRFHFAGFDEEELFVRQRQQRRHDNGGGRRCRTITRNIGNMIMTHTECT